LPPRAPTATAPYPGRAAAAAAAAAGGESGATRAPRPRSPPPPPLRSLFARPSRLKNAVPRGLVRGNNTTTTPARAHPGLAAPPRPLLLPFLALLALLLLLPRPAASTGTYDPCAPQGSVAKGDGFTLGVAYYPGGDVGAWDLDLEPCGASGRANLTAAGASSAVYRPALDAMTFMRSSPADEDALMAPAGVDVMSVVAYGVDASGSDRFVRSPPRRVRVKSPNAVFGDQTTGRVNALTLIARFDEGYLKYLQWHDLGCGDCAVGDACMKVGDGHTACAGTESECACDAADGANQCALDVVGSVADALRCQLTIATAFSGTDKHSVPLESAAQVERLGKYSVTGALRGAGAGALADAVGGRRR